MKKFYLILSILIPMGINAQTIYVDVDNNTGTENGSAEFPYKSLSDGIEAAQIGDTLFIRNGEYNATTTASDFLLKDGVITAGEDSSKTIINGGFENHLASMNHYTELSNLTCGEVSLGAGDGTATVVIKKCNLEGARLGGESGYTFIVEDCTIKNGVSNKSGENYWYVRNNIILNGGISDTGAAPDGVEVHIIENNQIFYDGGIDLGTSHAIIFAGTKSVTIRNNYIKGTGECTGVSLNCRYEPIRIKNNTIELDTTYNNNSNDLCGIYTTSGGGTIEGNTIIGGKYGYYSSSGTKLFSDNTITNSYCGLWSNGIEEICNNHISNCSGYAIFSDGFCGPVHDNIITNNDSAGIYLDKPVWSGYDSSYKIYRNIIKNSGWYDMVVAYNPSETDTIFAQHNVWDHEAADEILQNDILNLYSENVLTDIDSFIIPPDIPVLSLPENATTETDTSLNLSWQESTGAEYYKIQVSETSDFNTIFLEQDSISTLNFKLDSLNFSTTYYWRCAVENLAGESGWSETRQFKTKITTGINEMQSSALIKVYPNPASGKLYIELPPATTTFNLKIIDIHGRVILSQKLFSGKSIDVSGLPAGIYYINLQSKKEIYNARFVKKIG